VIREVTFLLQDIVDGIERIEEYVDGLSAADFAQDEKGQDAVLLRLQVIGQAVKSLPVDFRSAHPEVSWREAAGTRDVIVHEYFRIDLGLIWDTVHSDLPTLKAHVQRIIDGLA
jgi:uncharacterized protein with HEPN domain